MCPPKHADTMRIISWNCNMAFLRKSRSILELSPMICIVQEISMHDTSAINAPFSRWIGSSPHKGLAVIGFDEDVIALDDSCPPELPWAIPFTVGDFNILAVWASVHAGNMRYVRVLHHIIDRYAAFLRAKPSIVTGDFNSNTMWDGKRLSGGHAGIVDKLQLIGLKSLYHYQTGEPQGEESQPTFYLYRKPERPYHLDHAFVPETVLDRTRLTIGDPNIWLQLSDHMPLVVDIATETATDHS